MIRLSNLSIRSTGLLLVCLPIVFEAAFTGVLVHFLGNAESSGLKESSYRYLLAQTQEISNITYQATGELALYSMTQSQSHRRAYSALAARGARQISKIKSLLAEMPPDEQSRIAFDSLSTRFVQFNQVADAFFTKSHEMTIDRIELAAQMKLMLDDLLGEMQNFTDSISTRSPRFTEQALHERQVLLYAIGLGMTLNVILMIGLGILFGRDITQRLSILVGNTRLLRAGQTLSRRVAGTDEIAYLDNEFHDMASALNAANQRRSDVVSMLSHDLRTPITSISLFLERLKFVLERDQAESPILTQLAGVQRSSDFVIALINDFLDLEKIDGGNLSVELNSVDLKTAVADAISSVESIASSKTVVVQAVGDISGAVKADPVRFKQLLINLIGNAIHYSPSGTTVTVSVQPESTKLRISIADNGPGIAIAEQVSIFEPFYQVKGSTKLGTSGLGLAICRRLCELQKAEIGVESELGKGSKFWILFPNSEE